MLDPQPKWGKTGAGPPAALPKTGLPQRLPPGQDWIIDLDPQPKEEGEEEPKEAGKKRKKIAYSPEEWAAWEEEQKKKKMEKKEAAEKQEKEWQLQSKEGGTGDDKDKEMEMCYSCKKNTWDGKKCINQDCRKHSGTWTSSKTWNKWRAPQESDEVKQARAKAEEIIDKRKKVLKEEEEKQRIQEEAEGRMSPRTPEGLLNPTELGQQQFQLAMAAMQGQQMASTGPSLAEINKVLQRLANLEALAGDQTALILKQHGTIGLQTNKILELEKKLEEKEKEKKMGLSPWRKSELLQKYSRALLEEGAGPGGGQGKTQGAGQGKGQEARPGAGQGAGPGAGQGKGQEAGPGEGQGETQGAGQGAGQGEGQGENIQRGAATPADEVVLAELLLDIQHDVQDMDKEKDLEKDKEKDQEQGQEKDKEKDKEQNKDDAKTGSDEKKGPAEEGLKEKEEESEPPKVEGCKFVGKDLSGGPDAV